MGLAVTPVPLCPVSHFHLCTQIPTELGEGLKLCPVCRFLNKLCPSECCLFLFLFLTACHYRGQKHQRRGRSQGHKTSQKPHSTSYTNSGSPDCKWSPAGSRLAACLSDTVLFSTWQEGSLTKPMFPILLDSLLPGFPKGPAYVIFPATSVPSPGPGTG